MTTTTLSRARPRRRTRARSSGWLAAAMTALVALGALGGGGGGVAAAAEPPPLATVPVDSIDAPSSSAAAAPFELADSLLWQSAAAVKRGEYEDALALTQGALSLAAALGGGAPGGGGGGAQVDMSQIDSLDAVHLSEIILSKMVELVGGGEAGVSPSKLGMPGGEDDLDSVGGGSKGEEQFGDPLDVTDGLPNPRNNIRVKNSQQLRASEFYGIDSARGDEDDASGGVGMDVTALSEDPPDDPIAAAENEVLTRDFLKLSSSRQHSEQLRRIEQDARRRKMAERMEGATDGDRAAMQGRAARKKQQGDANKRLSAAPSHASVNKPLSIKESAIERSQMFLTAMPDLD